MKLSIYLAKEGITEIEDVILDITSLDVFEIDSNYSIDGKIFVGLNDSNAPNWLGMLEGLTGEEIALENKSTRAVCLIKRSDRIFILVFGFGRYLINPELLVQDFGVKVVLNSVSHSTLRSIDLTKIDDIVVHTRTQSTRASNINSFNIEKSKDLLKAVTGQPINEGLGNSISGSDGVYLNYKLEEDFSNLLSLLDLLLDSYNLDVYKEQFGWIDNLGVVRENSVICKLNEALLSLINANEIEDINLAPPEILDTETVYSFSFTRASQQFDELYFDDFINFIRKRKDEDLTLNDLKRRRIFYQNSNGTQMHWNLYNCIVFEISFDNYKYILNTGTWYKADNGFVNEVIDYVKEVGTANINLPDYTDQGSETEYNKFVAESHSNYLLMDTKNIYHHANPIEFCDLLSDKGQFIHIKPWRSSSTLSHLFAQGLIPSELMIQDIEFRNKVHSKINKLNSRFNGVIDPTDFNPEDHEIIYAIIHPKTEPFEEKLPFFSLVNFMLTTKRLSMYRYNVKKMNIKKSV